MARVELRHISKSYPGVQALVRALPPGAVVDLGPDCHTGSFFAAQESPSLAFLARHLTN